MFSFGLDDLQAAKNPQPPPSISAMDEEAQKRNTDCIYFLASPLTCKKGNNCEYRHSEAARMNPRDCWYWKSGNCLNARCSFRHVPLEGKPGSASISMPTASGASTSTAPSKPQLVSATSMTATAVPSKSKTPCYFFSQGYCAKNEKCPFMHGSSVASPIDTAAQQIPANGVNGKAVHASGRPLIVLKQNGLTSQEARPVTDGKSVALNDAYPISSKAPVPVQGMHQSFNGLERARFPERVATSAPFRQDRDSKKLMIQADRCHEIPDLAGRQRWSQRGMMTEQGLPDQNDCMGLVQTGDFRNLNGCRPDALGEVRPSVVSSDQSIQSEQASQSDSQESMKGLCNSPLASNGQDSFDTSGQAGSDSISGLPDDWELESSHNYDQPQHSLKHARQPRISFDVKTGGCNGQRAESEGHDTTGDLRNQLTKRRKNDSSPYLSAQHLQRRGQSDVVSNRRGGQRLNNGHLKQEEETCRLSTMKVDLNGVKGAQYDGRRGSSDLPLRRISPNADPKTEKIFKKMQSKGPASKHQVMGHSKVDFKETEVVRQNSKVASILEKRPHSSSRSTSKSTLPENMKETLTFTGPKSLAQIKAEKMAGGETAIKAIGSHDPITNTDEAGAKLADRKLAVPAESWDVAASDGGKLRRTRVGAINKCESAKQKTVNSEDFEGPKPLSLLLKRKRDFDSEDSDVKETMSGPIEVKGFMTESFEELEDGEVGDEDNESKEEDMPMRSCSLAPPQEDSPVISSSNTKEGVLQGLQRSGGEATEFDMESSEDGLKYDMEMEENAYGDEDYEIDDDDEDDFAKKLGRFFALSSE